MEKELRDFRHVLHEHAEVSGNEIQTKQLLMDYLKQHTILEVVDCGDWFYACHREENPSKPSIAIRADYDALATPCGKASHLCGHDGHATTLCYLARVMEGNTYNRNVFLIFQPEEETGQGALKCCKIFELENIDIVYGLHNLPGFEEGQVYCKYGTFACASRGVTIKFIGKPTHAAYPELGINPSYAVGKLLIKCEEYLNQDLYEGMTLCTVIGAQMGEKAFGAACENSELWLTMRAEKDSDLEKLYEAIISYASKLAKEYQLEMTIDVQDVFPSVENTKEYVETIWNATNGKVLEVPMRWSEDFGHYLHYCKGAFFGIGIGIDWPGLHTENYEYNDDILKKSMETFLALIKYE